MRSVPLLDRLINKIEIDWNTGCWLWTGCLAIDGYPHISNGKRNDSGRIKMAYAEAYKLFRGDIGEGNSHDHLCRVRRCINPWHIEGIPIKENILRGYGPTAINKRKTHCSRGHLLEGYNVIHRPLGRRGCRACYTISARKYKAKLRKLKLLVRTSEASDGIVESTCSTRQ
jgi:hypothetical protein